ncbi:MAG: DUF2303 family protein [Patescibacteria group bacterium]|nr:DUF2303 family protein [Patescibacteria group bacterium]
MNETDNVKTIVETAIRSAAPTTLHSGERYLWIHTAARGTEKIDLSHTLAKPTRKSGNVTVFDAASFNQVIADNSDAGNIAIYLDRNPETPSIVAVMNGHGKGGAGWADFRVNIAFRKTPQWIRWQGIDGKMLAQAAFAEFIEDNLDDIASPPKADFLEIVTYLQATRTVDFKSGIRLSSGAIQFQNLESVDAKVGPGSIAVPEQFTLGIAPMFGAPSYSIPVRFRYRLQDGKLMLGVKIQRVEALMGTLIEDVIAKIERGANVSVLDGLPPG